MAFAPIGPVVDKAIEKSVEVVPVKATTYTAGMLLEICGGKYAKYSVLCAVWATTTTAGLVSGNPALIAVGLEAGNEILEDFYR